jgi:glutamyl-tRNA synthetase
MQDPDPAFRDRVMFKISDRTHPKTGNKYRVYPSMEFSWGIDDHLFGMTHIIRGIEHQMSTRVQDFIRDIFSWEHPVSRYTGLLVLEGVKVSKSKGAAEVTSGQYIGWNDPRLWSLQSLRDRGILPESIREFIVSQGMSKSNTTVPIDVLYSINKKHLENVSRYFFVPKPVKIRIAGCPELEAELPLHPSENKGHRSYKTGQEFIISEDDLSCEPANYRMMHLLNFKMIKLHALKNHEFSFISVNPEPELKAKFIQWLPSEGNIKVKVRMPDNSIIEGLGEGALKKLKEDEIIQFERFGFVKLYKKEKDEMEFWFAHK